MLDIKTIISQKPTDSVKASHALRSLYMYSLRSDIYTHDLVLPGDCHINTSVLTSLVVSSNNKNDELVYNMDYLRKYLSDCILKATGKNSFSEEIMHIHYNGDMRLILAQMLNQVNYSWNQETCYNILLISFLTSCFVIPGLLYIGWLYKRHSNEKSIQSLVSHDLSTIYTITTSTTVSDSSDMFLQDYIKLNSFYLSYLKHHGTGASSDDCNDSSYETNNNDT